MLMGVRKYRTTLTLLEGEKVQSLWKTVSQFPKKLNMQLTYDPAIAHLLRKAKFSSCKHLSLNVYGSLIHYSPKVKTTQMPFKELAKQTVYTRIMEYYSWNKKKWLLINVTTWMNLQRIRLSEKKPVPKTYIPYDSIHLTFLKWQKVDKKNNR